MLWHKHYFCIAMSTGCISRPTLNQSEGTSLLITIAGQQKPLTYLSDVITVETSIRCILFTHQQMHFLLNLEKFKFILKYT